jgi:hypothetical protein
VAVGDLESDGALIEVVVASRSYESAVAGGFNETELWVWNPKASSTPPWGLFKQGERRLGVFPGTPAGPPPVPPTVTAVNPSSGSTDGGTAVTITGTLFQTGATVAFGATNATGVTVTNATTISATTPAGSPGAATVTVTNPDGGAGSLTNGFTYVAPPLTVTGISPKTGSAAGGTIVSIAGTGFALGAEVSIGGAAATGVSVVGGTSILATTPPRSVGPADVVVSYPAGASATLPGGFVYTASGSPARVYTVTPCRVIDTRNAAGPFGGPALAALAARTFNIPAGTCGIPADAAGISLNVTIADATTSGSLTMYPGSGAVTGTNTVTFRPGKNRANNVQIGLVGGVLSVYNDQTSGSVNLIVDVNGYFR